MVNNATGFPCLHTHKDVLYGSFRQYSVTSITFQ